MDKPAVIMNEAAFKILIQALTGKTIQDDQDEGVNSSAVDQFLKGWEQSKTDNPKARDYEAEHAALQKIMLGNGPMRLHDIYMAMKKRGVWRIDDKQANQRLKSVADRSGDIFKAGRGLYEMWAQQHE